MNTIDKVMKTAVSALLVAGAAAISGNASAAAEKQEQCAGVIKAAKNDCATSKNACHGHVMTDADPEAWIYVPKGTCDKIAGARVVTVTDPTPKK
jgi:uncharacterized membrane protein